jgi:hypothetical protein
MSHSQHNPDSDFSEEELSEAIHVRRVREASEEFYSFEESEYIEGNYEVQSQYDPSLSWYEEDKRIELEVESFRQSEANTAVTLYYPKHDDIFLPVSARGDIIAQKKFRFTPASIKHLRARSAPPAPLTAFQSFKRSKEFLKLEETVRCINDLIYKDDGKMDLDTGEGNNAGKKLLYSIEELMHSFAIQCNDRKYRDKFSQAYKVLYTNYSLCYLTEILSSAQEGYSYVIVNSEKYIFSPNVLRAGQKLFAYFETLKDFVKDIYSL